MQVLVGVGAAFGLRGDVVDLRRARHLTALETHLAQPGIAGEYAHPGAHPLGAVATLLSGTAVWIGEGAALAVCLVLLAVA